jgi:hypothetical protein
MGIVNVSVYHATDLFVPCGPHILDSLPCTVLSAFHRSNLWVILTLEFEKLARGYSLPDERERAIKHILAMARKYWSLWTVTDHDIGVTVERQRIQI